MMSAEKFKKAVYIRTNGERENVVGIYVSDLGRVKYNNYYNCGRVEIMDYSDYGDYVHIRSGGKSYQLHRLVLSTFCPKTDTYVCINHKDENPSNNRLDNLEWCSVKYNNNYGTRNERVSNSHKGVPLSDEHKKKIYNNSLIKLHEKNKKKINQYDMKGNILRTFDSIIEAEQETGVKSTNISACCKHKVRYKSAGGYKWEFCDDDFFTGNIAKSSRTDTNKDELK